jgi:hypothetical protein
LFLVRLLERLGNLIGRELAAIAHLPPALVRGD